MNWKCQQQPFQTSFVPEFYRLSSQIIPECITYASFHLHTLDDFYSFDQKHFLSSVILNLLFIIFSGFTFWHFTRKPNNFKNDPAYRIVENAPTYRMGIFDGVFDALSLKYWPCRLREAATTFFDLISSCRVDTIKTFTLVTSILLTSLTICSDRNSLTMSQ